MQGEHESNQARLRAKMARLKKEHDSEQKQTRREVDEEKARLKSDFKTMKAQLEEAHAAETKRLRRDIEAYSEDLLTRDDFKPMMDNEIKGRFLDLAQEIDTLARLEWKPNQKEWTNQILRRLSGNQRLLKKQILQDSVWVILHENIFSSPFKVFGEEGQRLESQWNDKYEQGWSPGTLPLSLL
jgi:ribosomal protein S17E